MTGVDTNDFTCVADHCITCGDEGIPMTVLELDARNGLACCADQSGASSMVEIGLVEPVSCGERLLVHAGTAIAVLTDTGVSE
jgi:hydrogenase maturation factor